MIKTTTNGLLPTYSGWKSGPIGCSGMGREAIPIFDSAFSALFLIVISTGNDSPYQCSVRPLPRMFVRRSREVHVRVYFLLGTHHAQRSC